MASVTEQGALEHRARLDLRYSGSTHRTDPANDRGARVIITVRPVKVLAYG